jgi:hypothetical protein
MNEELVKRLKSLGWRAGGMAFVVILNGLLTMLSDGTINVPAPYVVFIGLGVGEITKAINNRMSE